MVVLESHFAGEYGMPSTHAESSVCLPFFITFLWFSKRGDFFSLPFFLSFAASMLYCVVICASRIYLGVHTVFDIVGGLGVGFLVLFFSLFFMESIWLYFMDSGCSIIKIPNIPLTLLFICASIDRLASRNSDFICHDNFISKT